MSDNTIVNVEQSIAISDPGERDRDKHTRGDRFVIRLGNVAAWLFPILMVAICTQVVIRKFGFNQAWLDDAQWWMYGFAMLAGFGYAITTESHVRVDILHQHYSETKKARTEVFALGWLLLPFLILMTDVMFHYAYASWLAGEGSDSPNGLHRLYLLKMSLPILFGIAIVAAFSALYRHLKTLTQPSLSTVILAALPTFWFLAERLVYYALWWFVRWSQPELNPRRISKDPMLENTLWLGLAVLIAAMLFAWIRNRRTKLEN